MVGATTDVVLGLDGGTEGVRAGLFTPEGRAIAFARASYPTRHPRPAWAEQDPEDWWAAAIRAVRQLFGDGVEPSSVKGLAVACTSCSVVFSDDAGRPLRPALIWMDVRASAQAQRIGQSGDPALKYSGYTTGSAEWLFSKVLWVAENEPDTYRDASRITEYTDWLGYRLTGEWIGSINTAAIRGYYDREAGGWPGSLMQAIGLEKAQEKLVSEVLDMAEPRGHLTSDAAKELGLPANIPVATGGADAFVGMVGLDVLNPGAAALITGSSHLHLAQSLTPNYAEGMFGAYTDAVVPGQYTVEGGQVSTGSVVSWFRRLCGVRTDDELARAESYAKLQEEARAIAPGSDGVLALDFWQGNRTPYVDAKARGMIWGLSLSHGAPHIYRALLEAVCFGTENVLRTFSRTGQPITQLVACGGAVNSDLWMQIHADVSNLPITVTEVPEAVTLGSAILAAVAAGIHPNLHAAARAMVRVDRVITPEPGAHQAYNFYFDSYLASFEAMRDLMHKVVDHVSE